MPLRLGIVADPQYAAIPTWGTRHFERSLGKLGEAFGVFNEEPLDLCLTLGDLIDQGFRHFAEVLPLYGDLRHRHEFVIGNHDFEVAPDELALVPALLGRERRHATLDVAGWRIVLVDGTEVGVFSTWPGSPERAAAEQRLAALGRAKVLQAKPWNATMSEAQLAWLDAELARADREGLPALVVGHYPVAPAHDHNLWDDTRFVAIVTAHRSFRGYLNGHNHLGGLGQVAGRPFVTFKGMVDTPDRNAFALVELDTDRLTIRGFGREESRSLPIG